MLGQFLNGLKGYIRAEVRLLSPLSLEKAMEMALRVEEKNMAVGMPKTLLSSFKLGTLPIQTKGNNQYAASIGSSQTSRDGNGSGSGRVL